ncbi:MAG: hypothetical protein LBC82_00120 [Oscillospiraceae bacterium]|nr:hypothetical protein [Oscillospiraceae bacterium]
MCAFLALFTLFMLTMSLIFSFGGDAPSLFGRNVYIVKTDAVEFLKPGTALFTVSVPYEEIVKGDIVVFKSLETGRAGIAEIDSVQHNENVYRYNAVSERGVEIILTQSQIVGKATQYSDFFGWLIGFAKSPAGVMIVAVIPCMIILIYESSKSIFMALRKNSEITPVKKQDEIPTYVPRQKMSAMSAYSKTGNADNGDYDDDYNKVLDNITAKEDGFAQDDYPLFRAPGSKAVKAAPKTEEKPRIAPRTAPLSQKRLNQAIAEVNARKSTGQTGFPFDEPQALKAAVSTGTGEIAELKATGSPVVENVKRYMPKKNTAAQRVSQTASIPSLDRLLRDEDDPEAENVRYDLDSILFSIDKKK